MSVGADSFIAMFSRSAIVLLTFGEGKSRAQGGLDAMAYEMACT